MRNTVRKQNLCGCSAEKLFEKVYRSYDRPSTKKWVWFSFILFWAIMIFTINYLTPYLADDYQYLTRLDTVQSAGDLFLFLKDFYLTWGGRILGALYTQVFTMVGKDIFSLMNTLAYMGCVILTFFICRRNGAARLSTFLGIHLLLWFTIPDYGQIMFWLCGSSNYLWTILPILGIIVLFRKHSADSILSHNSGLTSLGMLILGLLAGMGMENSSAGMLVIVTLYMIYYKLHRIPISLEVVAGYVGSVIGFLFLVLAPGNQVRKELSDDNYQLSMIFKVAMTTYFGIMFMMGIIVLIAVMFVLSKKNRSGKDICSNWESGIFIFGSLTAAYSMVAAPTMPERTWFSPILYAIIAAGILYESLDRRTKLVRRIVSIFVIFFFVQFAVMWTDTLVCTYELKTQTMWREKEIIRQKAEGKENISIPVISYSYPFLSKHDALSGLSDIKADSQYWINQSIADYYQVKSVTGVSKD